jgi:hypothetical protein
VKVTTIDIYTLAHYSIWLKDRQQAFLCRCRGQLCYISIFILIHLLYLKKISCSRIEMVCTPIYSFLASEGKYLEPATSSHPIKGEGYEIHLDFISLVR